MKAKKILTYFIIIFILNIFMISMNTSLSAKAYEQPAGQHRVYVFAIEDDLPPFSFTDQSGNLSGFAVEIIKKITQREHLNSVILPMNLYQAINALKNGKVDGIVGLKYTADRDKVFDFSNGYFTMSQSIVVPKDKTNIQIMSDLHNQTIAIENDASVIQIVENIRRAHMNMAMNEKDALRMLTMKRADGFIGNKWTADTYLTQWGKRNQYTILKTPLQPADYAIAVQDGNTSLLSVLNEGLLTLKATGEYDDIYYQWFGNHTAKMTKEFKYLLISLLTLLLLFIIGLIIGIAWNKRLKSEVDRQTKDLSEANYHLENKQREIEDSNMFKEQVLNSTPSGIVTFNLEGDIMTMNGPAKGFLGEPDGAMMHPLTLHVLQLIHEMQEQSDVKSGELELYYEGKLYVMYYHLTYLMHADHRKTGFLLTFTDRTEERRLQEKLSVQEKMHALGQLSAGIAHEMRNPLTSIKTFIELLPEKYNNPSFREAIRRHVPTEINRLNKIIGNLLDYSRPSKAQKSTWAVGDFLDSILILFTPTINKEKVDWKLSLEPKLTIFADPNQIKQVMINMLLNAVDAMRDVNVKTLEIRGYAKDGRTYIKIQDSGIGMSSYQMERIFEPFYTSKASGVGLGMTICYQLIQENHGDIHIESQVGEGTQFTISLPTQE